MKLITEKNEEITKADDILKYEESFYKDLYPTHNPTPTQQQDTENASKLFKV